MRIELQDAPKAMIQKVKKIPGVRDVQLDNNILNVICDPQAKAHIITAIEDSGGTVTNFTTVEPSLEEVFLKYTEG